MKMKFLNKIIAIALFTFFGYMAIMAAGTHGILEVRGIVYGWAGLLMVALIVTISMETILFE